MSYGTVEYYAEELATAKLKYELMNEAITERLKKDLNTGMTKKYLKILTETQDSVEYQQNLYDSCPKGMAQKGDGIE